MYGHGSNLGLVTSIIFSAFLWPFLPSSKGVIPYPKMVFIFPILCIFQRLFFAKFLEKSQNVREKVAPKNANLNN